MIPHPWNDDYLIELMDDGSVCVISVSKQRIVKTFKSKYGKIYGIPEILALCDEEAGEFILLVCDGFLEQPWRVFSSATDTWTEMDWPSTKGATRTSFVDPATNNIYCHINREYHWTCLKLP